jgi:hypothetical protein
VIPHRIALEIVTATAGPLGYLPLVGIALLVVGMLYAESPAGGPHQWRPDRTTVRLATAVVLLGFATLALRLVALSS